MALLNYYPEMNQDKPAANIEARMARYSNHWYIKTPLELKGRGIRFENTLTPEQLTEQGQRLVGWHEYRVTDKAFETLCKKHDVVTECLL